MAQRITEKHLQAMVNRLNKLTNSPTEYMTNGKINVGYYHIDYAYGGVQLVRTMNEGGGVTCPLSNGHMPKRELYDQIWAFIRGIELAKEQQS